MQTELTKEDQAIFGDKMARLYAVATDNTADPDMRIGANNELADLQYLVEGYEEADRADAAVMRSAQRYNYARAIVTNGNEADAIQVR